MTCRLLAVEQSHCSISFDSTPVWFKIEGMHLHPCSQLLADSRPCSPPCMYSWHLAVPSPKASQQDLYVKKEKNTGAGEPRTGFKGPLFPSAPVPCPPHPFACLQPFNHLPSSCCHTVSHCAFFSTTPATLPSSPSSPPTRNACVSGGRLSWNSDHIQLWFVQWYKTGVPSVTLVFSTSTIYTIKLVESLAPWAAIPFTPPVEGIYFIGYVLSSLAAWPPASVCSLHKPHPSEFEVTLKDRGSTSCWLCFFGPFPEMVAQHRPQTVHQVQLWHLKAPGLGHCSFQVSWPEPWGPRLRLLCSPPQRQLPFSFRLIPPL
eukprot:GGOE01008730.1.p1 GENE.GGOE01008730.1~~GGOE01008730.1.p1  ORF type:complete len:317 (+),score=-4.84 GGOE01008730.1:457-1407(+)